MAANREEQYRTDFPQPGLDADYTKGRFAGKVCIITGGASGIGRATAERFLNDGASVHIFDINDQNLEDVKQVFQSKGLPVEVYKVDVTEHAQCQAAVAKVAEKHGGHIHYLVNSAAIFIVKGFEDYTKEDWTKTTSVHVAGTSTMVQVCLKYMVQAGGKNCAIVNMSSADADGGIRGNWVYSSAKAGIRTLTRCMALDLSTHGIRVNSVSPGWVWSPVNLAFMKNREMVEKDYVAKFHMLKRFAEMSEVAATICFLCSRDASFITAADLQVDGGRRFLYPEAVIDVPDIKPADEEHKKES